MFHDFSNNDKLTLNISIWINATLQHTKVTNSIPYTTLQILGLTFIKPRSSAEGLLKKHGLLGTWYILKPTSWGFLCSTSHIPKPGWQFWQLPCASWSLNSPRPQGVQNEAPEALDESWDFWQPWSHCPKDLNWHPSPTMSQMYTSFGEIASH